MTTKKQTEANRNNAALSTGPITAVGKRAISLNALRHGLLSAAPVLPDEDEGDYAELLRGLYDELEPVGIIELALVDNIAFILWRLNRAKRIDKELYLNRHYQDEISRVEKQGNDAVFAFAVSGDVADQKQNIEDEREAAVCLSSVPFRTDTTSLFNLDRYETGLERRLYGALSRLDEQKGKALHQKRN